MNPLGQLGTRVTTAQLAVASTMSAATASLTNSPTATANWARARLGQRSVPSARTLSTAMEGLKRAQLAAKRAQLARKDNLALACPAQTRSGVHTMAWSGKIGGQNVVPGASRLSASFGIAPASWCVYRAAISSSLAPGCTRSHSTRQTTGEQSSSSK